MKQMCHISSGAKPFKNSANKMSWSFYLKSRTSEFGYRMTSRMDHQKMFTLADIRLGDSEARSIQNTFRNSEQIWLARVGPSIYERGPPSMPINRRCPHQSLLESMIKGKTFPFPWNLSSRKARQHLNLRKINWATFSFTTASDQPWVACECNYTEFGRFMARRELSQNRREIAKRYVTACWWRAA